jgi:osmotically-inducible protein OsmY
VSDDELKRDVEDELLWEPRVDNRAIAVSAHDGQVELRGTVGSFREKRDATAAAKRVYGVKNVDNDLDVRLLDEEQRDDADIRGGVLQALTLDSLVPRSVDASVTDGTVTLTGTVSFRFQSDEAEYVAGNVAGVYWVYNDIAIKAPEPNAGDVEHAIKKAFKRNARLDAKGVSVHTHDGTVTLSGEVSSWAEHDSALAAAWAAPGVADVKDRLDVDYY